MEKRPSRNGFGLRVGFIRAGVFLLIVSSARADLSLGAPPREILGMVTQDSPELESEVAHELALKEHEHSARAESRPQTKAHFGEQFVQSDTDSGFLTSGRVELTLFQKTRRRLLLKISQLERANYQMFRRGLRADRALRFALAYNEAQGILAKLPKLQEKKELILELVEREKTLVKERLKTSDEVNQLRKSLLLLDQTVRHGRARFETLQAMVSYLANVEDQGKGVIKESGEPLPIEWMEDFGRWKSRALAIHPEIARLETEIQKQQTKVHIAQRDWLPEISLVSSYIRDPRFGGNENQLFGGVEAKWDILDFGASRHEARKEKALTHELKAKLRDTSKKFSLGIDEAFRFYKASHSIWMSHKSYVASQRESLESLRRRFQEGEISWKKFTLSRIGFLDEEIALETAKEEVFRRESLLVFALGFAGAEEVNGP